MTDELTPETEQPQFKGLSITGEQIEGAAELSFQSWSPFAGAAYQDQVVEKYHRMREDIEEKLKEIQSREQRLAEQEEAIKQHFEQRETEIQDLLNQAEEKSKQTTDLIFEVLNQIQSEQKDVWKSRSKEMVHFAVGLVEHLLAKKFSEDPDCLVKQIEACVEESYDEEIIIVHLSTEDLDQLQSGTSEAFHKLRENKKIKWVGDMKLNKGQVLVDAKQYRMDASIDTLIKNVKQDLITGFSESIDDSVETGNDTKNSDDAN